jgi:hypothetical protein
MARSRLVIVAGIAVVGGLVAGGIVAGVGRSGAGHSAPAGPAGPTAGALGVPVGVSLGGLTPQATRITVGGRTYPLRPGQDGTRSGHVVLAPDAGGIAVVRDRAGQVLATAPVWAVPGQPARAAAATCRSTAFDQFLLTPGVAGPDPLGVDLLWSLAGHGQTGHDVTVLGQLICAGLPRDPGQLAHPSPAEIAAYDKIFTDYARQLPRLAAQLPSLASSVAGIRSELTAAGGAASTKAYVTAYVTPSGASADPSGASADPAGPCADQFLPVATAAGSTSALALCTDERTVDAENNSAAWAFLYDVPSDGRAGPGLPGWPSAIVPGRTSDFPSVEKIAGALAHDYIAGQVHGACTVLSFARIDVCGASKPPKSAVSALFNLTEAGTMQAQAAAGYYSIAWGNGRGDQSTFPAGATLTAEQTRVQYSEDLTFISSVIVPTVGLILDHQLKQNLAPDQLPLLLPVFNELAGTALSSGVNGAPTTMRGQLRAVTDTAKTLFGQPGLLGDIMAAFFPDVTDLGEDLARQLAEYLAGLEIPVAGWAALLVKLVVDGSSAATLALSIAGMFDALTKSSYSSWTPVLTAAAARSLPLFTPGAGPACPAPPQPAAIPPGAPGAPECEWVVAADLDGNGIPDRLVTWQTADRRGAVAYLDDGSVHPLQSSPSAVALSTVPWAEVTSGVGDTNQPMRILRLTASRRQQVLLIDNIGAVGDDAALIGLDPAGDLRLVANELGQVQDVLTAADLGCASQAGHPLFVEGALGRGEPGGATGPAPGYGVSRSFYQVSADLRMRLVDYRGQVVPSLPAPDPFQNDCTGSVPAAPAFYPWATTAGQAVVGLVTAASSKNAGQASAFEGGGYADFSGQGYEPDGWNYLTATQGLNPADWLNRRASCTSSPYDATCTVIGADGEPLTAEVANMGDNWVVTGLRAG